MALLHAKFYEHFIQSSLIAKIPLTNLNFKVGCTLDELEISFYICQDTLLLRSYGRNSELKMSTLLRYLVLLYSEDWQYSINSVHLNRKDCLWVKYEGAQVHGCVTRFTTFYYSKIFCVVFNCWLPTFLDSRLKIYPVFVSRLNIFTFVSYL